MWPVRFTEAARAELIEAQDLWYEAEVPGLGGRFRGEIDSVVGRMADNPRQFPAVFKTLGRARAKKFPYALFFLVEPDVKEVVDIVDMMRKMCRYKLRNKIFHELLDSIRQLREALVTCNLVTEMVIPSDGLDPFSRLSVLYDPGSDLLYLGRRSINSL